MLFAGLVLAFGRRVVCCASGCPRGLSRETLTVLVLVGPPCWSVVFLWSPRGLLASFGRLLGALVLRVLALWSTSQRWADYEACIKRVAASGDEEAHCTGQYLDFWKCVDVCVRWCCCCCRPDACPSAVCRAAPTPPVRRAADDNDAFSTTFRPPAGGNKHIPDVVTRARIRAGWPPAAAVVLILPRWIALILTYPPCLAACVF